MSRALPRRQPENCPGYARQHASSASRRPKPSCPASIPLPPRRRHPTFTRSYPRHAPITLPGLPTGVPNPSGPASIHLSPRRRYPQLPRTYHAGILNTVLDCPVQIPAPPTGVPNPDGRRHFPCPHDAGIPNTPTPPHPWPAWPRQIAGTASRRPQRPPTMPCSRPAEHQGIGEHQGIPWCVSCNTL